VKALLVDPDPQRAPVLAQALKAGGAAVSIAGSASFALTMLEWNTQDVIISRARLGDMEGHELCTIVRSDPSTKEIRFVLIVGPGESAPTQTSAAGVDLLLPDALSNATIVTRVVQLLRRQQEATSPFLQAPTSVAPTPPLVAPSARPIAPPRVIAPPPAAPAPPPQRPLITPPRAPQPIAAPPRPSIAPVAPPPPRPVAPPPAVVAPPPLAPSPPVAPPPAATTAPPASSTAPPASSTAMPAMAGLDAVGTTAGARTFQGALGVLEIEELTQAIAVGGKTGRLLLVLSTGGGLIVFEGGRVTHAEYGGQAGEAAFGALVTASHRERGGKFCFIPVHPNELVSQPRTVVRGVEQLLLDVARAMDEERRG